MKRKPMLFKAIKQEQKQKNINIANTRNKLIIIGNLSKRAGSTFITLNLARILADYKILTSVIELPLDKPYIFDTIGLNIRLNNDEFPSYPHIIVKDELHKENEFRIIDDYIVWMVPDPRLRHIKNWEYKHTVKLVHAANKTNVSIIDCGEFLEHESVKPIIDFADLILIIIDPLPSECMQNNDRFLWLLKLKNEGYPIKFLINRFNSGVNKKSLLDYLNIKPTVFIPAINADIVYKAYYNCKIPVEILGTKHIFYKSLLTVIKNEMLF